jgi:hypothetical protein
MDVVPARPETLDQYLPAPDPRMMGVRNTRTSVMLDSTSDRAQKLLGHWLDAANGRLLPRKTDLRPEKLGRTLAYILIYDYRDRDDIHIRLAGSSFRAIHKRELTGTNFLDMTSGADRTAASARLFGMMDHPCGILATNTSTFASGMVGRFLSFGLPLADRNGQPRYSIHVSEYISGDTSSMYGGVERLAAAEARYVDIGAGVPDFKPPF